MVPFRINMGSFLSVRSLLQSFEPLYVSTFICIHVSYYSTDVGGFDEI